MIYLNTDFDLKSESPFDTLHQELSARCLVLYYTNDAKGDYHARFESEDAEAEGLLETGSGAGAERDILLIAEALKSLSDAAKKELAGCYLREFNMEFECGEPWAYSYQISHRAVRAVSDMGCSLAVTLYPIQHPAGTTPRE